MVKNFLSKYEYKMFSNNKVTKVCIHCHGNVVSLVTSHTVELDCSRHVSTKYEPDNPLHNRVVNVCHCYHGNKDSLETSPILH